MENFTKEASVDSAYNATNLDVSANHSEQTSESDCHETPPADLIRSGTSFAESESNDTEEEHHVRHSLAFTGDFDSFNPIATSDEVRIKALCPFLQNVPHLTHETHGVQAYLLHMESYPTFNLEHGVNGDQPEFDYDLIFQSDVGSSPVKSEEESDYEEPRKMNGTPSSSLGDTEIKMEHDGAEEAILAPTTGDVPLEESAEREACDKCLKCGELINSDEKVNTACPHFHVNCFRCSQCDCRITSDFLLVNGAPYCKNHSTFLSSGDTAKEVNLSVTKQDDCEVSFDASSRPPGLENRNVQDSHRGSPPPSDDILPPTGSAKRLVEQWSNIEILKTNQNFTNTALSDSPQYAPNTAKTIAAKFSAGTTDDQQSPRPKVSMEPAEQWPSQGQARGLIAKFSAMHS